MPKAKSKKTKPTKSAAKPKKSVKPKKTSMPVKKTKATKAVKPTKSAKPPNALKPAFKTADMKKFRVLLLDRRKELMSEMVALMKEQVSSTPKDTSGDLSSHAYHMADQGTDAMEREMAFMFASKSGRLVYHIDEAIRRIDDGSYGLCFQCKKPITVTRLKAVPHARLCIKCKESEEGRRSAGK